MSSSSEESAAGELGDWNQKDALAIWDTEYCKIPESLTPEMFLNSLSYYVRSIGFDVGIKILAVGPFKSRPETKDTLIKEGVGFFPAVKNKDKRVPRDAKNQAMSLKLIRFEKSGVNVPLIMIAGNGKHNGILKRLMLNHRVFWIYPRLNTSNETRNSLSPTSMICLEDLLHTYRHFEERSRKSVRVEEEPSGPGTRKRKAQMDEQKGRGKGKRKKMEEQEEEGRSGKRLKSQEQKNWEEAEDSGAKGKSQEQKKWEEAEASGAKGKSQKQPKAKKKNSGKRKEQMEEQKGREKRKKREGEEEEAGRGKRPKIGDTRLDSTKVKKQPKAKKKNSGFYLKTKTVWKYKKNRKYKKQPKAKKKNSEVQEAEDLKKEE